MCDLPLHQNMLLKKRKKTPDGSIKAFQVVKMFPRPISYCHILVLHHSFQNGNAARDLHIHNSSSFSYTLFSCLLSLPLLSFPPSSAGPGPTPTPDDSRLSSGPKDPGSGRGAAGFPHAPWLQLQARLQWVHKEHIHSLIFINGSSVRPLCDVFLQGSVSGTR